MIREAELFIAKSTAETQKAAAEAEAQKISAEAQKSQAELFMKFLNERK